MYEPSTRVPLIITPFNVPEFSGGGGQVVTQLTSHVDILPTLVRWSVERVPGHACAWVCVCRRGEDGRVCVCVLLDRVDE